MSAQRLAQPGASVDVDHSRAQLHPLGQNAFPELDLTPRPQGRGHSPRAPGRLRAPRRSLEIAHAGHGRQIPPYIVLTARFHLKALARHLPPLFPHAVAAMG